MKKLRLNLDALAVDSFDTITPDGAGTVHGHETVVTCPGYTCHHCSEFMGCTGGSYCAGDCPLTQVGCWVPTAPNGGPTGCLATDCGYTCDGAPECAGGNTSWGTCACGGDTTGGGGGTTGGASQGFTCTTDIC